MVSQQVKGFLSVLAAIFHQCVLYSLFILSNITIYVMSYLRKTDPSLTYEHGYFLSPINCLSMTIFCSLGGVVEKKIGPHL